MPAVRPIVQRDQSHQFGAVHNREPAQMMIEHQSRGVGFVRVDRNRDRRCRHQVSKLDVVRIQIATHDVHRQVAICDDANERFSVVDDDGANVIVIHLLERRHARSCPAA
jgi:hypothetical protein